MDGTADHKVLLAAYFKARAPALSQEIIGEQAGLGKQPQVARLLQVARKEGYLREVFQFPSKMPLDERRQLEAQFEQAFYERHADLEAALIERAEALRAPYDGATPFRRLHVVATPDWGEGDVGARERAFTAFGVSAADIVANYIDEAESVCVAWGRTLDVAVRNIPPRTKAPDRKKTFMPIAGEPTNFEPNGISPSDAASFLAAAWKSEYHLSLRGVQARIPRSVYEHDHGGIARKLASYSTNYEQIFGQSSDRLINKAAMILTGIGDVRTSTQAGATRQADPWYQETEKAEDPDVLGLAVGNIGGVWIARDGPGDDAKRKVQQVNERWLGAQHDDFMRCSRRADMSKRPGVVVLAVEPEKAEIVIQSLYLVNVLIVSRQLADALAEKLEVQRS
jgi:DNA-binding transcriptional regulator LsrR (DeoR family)